MIDVIVKANSWDQPMMNLSKTILSVFLAAAFAASSFNVSATESLTGAEESTAKTVTAAERMKLRTIKNLIRSRSASARLSSR
jgi:hypothetical protein